MSRRTKKVCVTESNKVREKERCLEAPLFDDSSETSSLNECGTADKENKLSNTIDLTNDAYTEINGVLSIYDSPAHKGTLKPPSEHHKESEQVIDLCSSPEPDDEPMEPKRKEASPKKIPTCPICFDNLLYVSDVATTKCGHMFCKGCILNSIRMKALCPVCRKKILKGQIITVFMNNLSE